MANETVAAVANDSASIQIMFYLRVELHEQHWSTELLSVVNSQIWVRDEWKG